MNNLEPVSNKSEFILCAGTKIDGKIFYGFRHGDCKHLAEQCGIIVTNDNYEDGFLTSMKRFVNRKEAFKIAKNNNQIWHNLFDDVDENILTSEDLY